MQWNGLRKTIQKLMRYYQSEIMFSEIIILIELVGLSILFLILNILKKIDERLMRTNLVFVRKIRIFRYKLKNKGYGKIYDRR